MLYESKHYGLFEVVEDVAWNNVIVRFVDTGYTTRVRRCRLKDRSIFDPYVPSVYGVGFQGEGLAPTKNSLDKKKASKEYAKWKGMFQRCYDPKYLKKKPTYSECSVAERWHNFQNFYNDLKKLPGYDLFESGIICHLDKDLLVPGNKTYGPETCCFLEPKENSSLRSYDFSTYIRK